MAGHALVPFPWREADDPEDGMRCPACGDWYVHVDAVSVLAASGTGVRVHASGEDGESTVTVESAPAGVQVGRRHLIRLHGYCEQGHAFDLDLRQHKGTTLTSARVGTLPTEASLPGPLPWL